MSKMPLRVIYDGECLFCTKYVQMLRLQGRFAVELVNARQEPERVDSCGLDLNEGMIADLDGQVHHGADAVWLLSTLSESPGLFSWRQFTRALYPWLRCGRHLTLTVLGRKPI